LILICTSQKLSEEQSKNLDMLFNTAFGRNHLCGGLFQTKFKNGEFQYLGNESYDDMYKILDKALTFISTLNLNDFIYFEQARMLTKSTFFYYK
jgi:hypothetical protein